MTVEQMLPLVYEELRELAARYLESERRGHTLQPTALVHEAYLRLRRGRPPPVTSRAHFIGIAARVIREVLVDHARGHGARKRGSPQRRVPLGGHDLAVEGRVLDVLAIDEALVCLAAKHARAADVAEMRFFGGLTLEETAEVLGVSRKTAAQDWRFARAWLSARLSGE